MTKYILTSPSFAGHVVFGYPEAGYLALYHDESQMNEAQREWLIRNFPWQLGRLDKLAQAVKGRLEEVPEDLSFDVFWARYGKKINRKRCEPLWKKLPDAERMQALRSIEPYKNYLKRSGWRGQADPEKYLRDRYYETNWNAEL